MKQNKVLVTGGSGFIGSHVADVLEEKGYEVILFYVAPSMHKTKSQQEFIGDILNPSDIKTAMKGCNAVYSQGHLVQWHPGYLNPGTEEKKIVRRGDGEEIREYIHVKDAAQLSVDALDEKYKNTHLIITGNQQIKIKDSLIMIKEIFKGEIEIELGLEADLHHYEITPYNYKPQVAKKITPDAYYDLGQGLMDQIYDLEMSLDGENEYRKFSLRKRKK